MEEANGLIALHDLRGYLARTRNGLVEAYLNAADATTGEERQRWAQSARRAWQAARPQARIERVAIVGLERWAGALAWLDGRPGAARSHWERSIGVAQELGARFDEALTHRELGRRAGEPASLQRAAEIFEKVGARGEAAAARALL